MIARAVVHVYFCESDFLSRCTYVAGFTVRERFLAIPNNSNY